MNCPVCFSIMRCESEIHYFNNGHRMDLHCFNPSCESRKLAYTPHMGVIAYTDQTWVCQKYHLPFEYKNKWYALVGQNFNGHFLVSWGGTNWKVIQSTATEIKELHSINPPLIKVDFIPISTGDDMHHQAQKLFERLIKLIPFI